MRKATVTSGGVPGGTMHPRGTHRFVTMAFNNCADLVCIDHRQTAPWSATALARYYAKTTLLIVNARPLTSCPHSGISPTMIRTGIPPLLIDAAARNGIRS